MKVHRILTSLAVFSLVFGLAFAPEALGPRHVTVTFSIPAGANRFVRWGFDVLTAGVVSGNFVTSSGGAVGVYVMTQAQQDVFVSGDFRGAITFVQGPSGNYSAPFGGGGKYFLVVVHGNESAGFDQSGSVLVRIAAVSTSPFLVVLGSTVAAIALASVGLLLRARFRRTARALPPEGGVVYFEPPTPPQ